MYRWGYLSRLLLFFFILGIVILLFKYNRVVFVLIGFEFLMLGTFYHLLFYESEIMLLFFLFSGVISSVFLLVLLLGLVKRYGSDYCLF